MIDFALEAERDAARRPREAIYQACVLRFRPIMMTTLAALFGALPLALGSGDGAELRRPLGIAIVGGLLVSQLLTLYTTPVVYLYLDRFRLWASSRWSRRPGRRTEVEEPDAARRPGQGESDERERPRPTRCPYDEPHDEAFRHLLAAVSICSSPGDGRALRSRR